MAVIRLVGAVLAGLVSFALVLLLLSAIGVPEPNGVGVFALVLFSGLVTGSAWSRLVRLGRPRTTV